MNIAMVGTKGIPAKWGGIETYVEQISSRLVDRGHNVTVFSSKWYCNDYKNKFYKGIRIHRVPTIHSQAADALSNAFLAVLFVIFGKYDIVHFHGYGSYFFVPIVRLFCKRTIITAHGVDSGWDNPKYSRLARFVIKMAFRIGINYAHCVTTVAKHLKFKINKNFNLHSYVLASGISENIRQPPLIIKEKFNLLGGDYILFLGRIDPIKRVDWVLCATEVIKNRFKIVIAGGSQDSVSNDYFQNLQEKYKDNPQIIFTGSVHGVEKEELLSNCAFFVSPSKNEGLPITLLEALSYGRCSIVTNIDAYNEVIENGVNGFLCQTDDIDDFKRVIDKVLDMAPNLIDAISSSAKNTVKSRFNWDVTLNSYENIYNNLMHS